MFELYLFVAGPSEDYPLLICHALFDDDLLPVLFFDSFFTLAFLTPGGMQLSNRPQDHAFKHTGPFP